jgi:hypothetical protein
VANGEIGLSPDGLAGLMRQLDVVESASDGLSGDARKAEPDGVRPAAQHDADLERLGPSRQRSQACAQLALGGSREAMASQGFDRRLDEPPVGPGGRSAQPRPGRG